LGAKIVPVCNETNKKRTFYLFSGQAAHVNLANPVKFCAPELYKFDAGLNSWNLVGANVNKKINGRKNHAMTHCKDFLFVSGGSSANSDLMSDFLRFDTKTNNWH